MAALCENRHEIDLARLRRLKPGGSLSIKWSRGGRPTGSVSIEASQQTMRLAYRYQRRDGAWQEAQEILTFTETETRFGGRRRWFECPSCGRPCRVLYRGERFLCRLCQGLRYASQYETAGGRARNRAQKLRTRLGGSANLLEAFPTRPKHMQLRTYCRLRELDTRLVSHSTAEVARFVQVLRQRGGAKIVPDSSGRT
jgi:hypothetical protein